MQTWVILLIIVANANALSTFSKTMSTMGLARLESWGDSDAMDTMSSAYWKFVWYPIHH